MAAHGGLRMLQKPCHSSQSQSFPFPSQDQSKPPLPRNTLFISCDLFSHPSSLFLLSQQLLHPSPAVLEGKDTNLPAPITALRPLLAPHAGGSLARPELPSPCGCRRSPRTCGRWSPFVLLAPTSRVSPQAGGVNPKSGVPSLLPFKTKISFFF